MTTEEKKRLKKTIVATASYYSQNMTDDVLLLYVEDLQDLDIDAVEHAYQVYRRNPKNTRAPLPAVIRQLVDPDDTVDEADQGREAASRIWAALSRFGAHDWERAREYIGELGWSVVQMNGGWSSLCASTLLENQTTHLAQWRDLGASLARKTRAGIPMDLPPGLPAPDRTGGLKRLGAPDVD
jgi:hypothetical protein